jgi:hypothetical protein
MDDMLSKISELLSDPAQAEKIKQIADSLSGINNENDETAQESHSTFSEPVSSQNSDNDLMFSLFGNGGFSKDRMSRNIALLHAITPYLRPSRASKISSAIKAIQVIDILSKAR